MDIERLKKRLLEALEEALEEGAEETTTAWEPKEGDEYYFAQIYGTGAVVGSTSWSGDGFDRAANEVGNVFRTKEEAEKAVDWFKARKVLFDDAKGFKPNWKDDQEYKWAVSWDCDGIRLFISLYFSETSSPGPYFASKEDAEASSKTHEKEWKIYLLGGDSND